MEQTKTKEPGENIKTPNNDLETKVLPAEGTNPNLSAAIKRIAKVGRPQKWNNPEELNQMIQEYFIECETHKEEVYSKEADRMIVINSPEIPTIAGLAFHLGTDRGNIYAYRGKPEFSNIIKMARDYILTRFEKKMANVNGNIGGLLFLAKNYGYSDQQDIRITGPTFESFLKDSYKGKAEDAEFTEVKE